MTRSIDNRPFKFGQDDRRELIVQDSEVSLVAINDTSGNPIFLGRSKAGTSLTVAKWQIRKVTYDSNDGVTRVEWAQNDVSAASTNYELIWNADSDLTITGITQANPAVVTVSALGNIVNGDKIVILDVLGMTQVNFTGSNLYTVANINVPGLTFELSGTDSSAFGVYSSAGTVVYGDVVNYTYA